MGTDIKSVCVCVSKGVIKRMSQIKQLHEFIYTKNVFEFVMATIRIELKR